MAATQFVMVTKKEPRRSDERGNLTLRVVRKQARSTDRKCEIISGNVIESRTLAWGNIDALIQTLSRRLILWLAFAVTIGVVVAGCTTPAAVPTSQQIPFAADNDATVAASSEQTVRSNDALEGTFAAPAKSTPEAESAQISAADDLGVNSGGHIEIDPDDGRGHIFVSTPYQGTYSVVPATSGPHWSGRATPAGVPSPARWGRYESVLPDEVLIHNLEHGGIGIHYDCNGGCPEIVKALNDILPLNPSQYIMSPYTGLPSKIAITAWRHHLYLDEVNVEEIRRFINEYQDRAPESVPQNMLLITTE